MNKTNETQRKIYENTNLAESYSGTVTPLTASFAQDVYEGVYRHFAAFMGVSRSDAKANEWIFSRMVVVIGHHLYYDLDAWYTLVRLLPGYAYNKSFFEQMLGVKPDERSEQGTTPTSRIGSILARMKLVLQATKILVILLVMPLLVWRFNRRFDRSYRRFTTLNLDELSEAELIDHYQTVRNRLVKLWRTPIANDFGVMVSAGILRKLSERWGVERTFIESLESRSRAHLATLDPGRELVGVLASVQDDGLRSLVLGDENPDEVMEILKRDFPDHPTTVKLNGYISQYGSRVPSELKLETHTLNESPGDAIRLLRAVAKADQHELALRLRLGNQHRTSVSAERLDLSWWRRWVFSSVYGWAKAAIGYREATRLRRSQIFGHARQTFLALGRALAKRGVLSDERDVFYLTVPELKSIDGLSDAKATVLERRKSYEGWSNRTLQHRYETTLSVSELESHIIATSERVETFAEGLSGTVASTAGRDSISGEVMVVRTFDQALDYRDKILFTTFTDPGWTMVFSLVKAIVVERGGLLSHASIVAREMQVPCIIGVSGATDRLRSGQNVTLDLKSGEIIES